MSARTHPGRGRRPDTPRARRREITRLAVPATAALIADPLLGLVDTAVAGRLGTSALAALAVSVALLATVSWMFNFLQYGTTSMVAQSIGADRPEAAGRRIVHAAWFAAGIGAVLSVVVLVAAPLLVRLLGAGPTFADDAAGYLRVRAVGLLPLLVTYVGHGAYRGVSDTRTPMLIVVGANLLNGALDVGLVFGLGLGLTGIAWATVAAEVSAAAAFALLLARSPLPLQGHGRPDRAELRGLVAVSRDLFLRTGSLVVGFLVVTSMAARLGEVTAAAHQVLWQVWNTVALFIDGLAIAGQAMIGTALGAGAREEARRTAWQLTRWGLALGVVLAVVLLAGSAALPRLFTDDATVLDAVAGAWWLASLGHVLNGVTFTLDGVFMGAGDFAYLRRWSIVSSLLVAAPLAVLVWALDGDLLGLWLAISAMLVVRLGALLRHLRGTAWTAAAGA